MSNEINDIEFKHSPRSILNENYCVAIPVNSEKIFLFWKFSSYKLSEFENSFLDRNITIRVFEKNGNKIAEIETDYMSSKIYIAIPQAGLPIYAVIYVKDKYGNIGEIARSNEVTLSYERELRKEYNYLR